LEDASEDEDFGGANEDIDEDAESEIDENEEFEQFNDNENEIFALAKENNEMANIAE
jgi:hypothetical protein